LLLALVDLALVAHLDRRSTDVVEVVRCCCSQSTDVREKFLSEYKKGDSSPSSLTVSIKEMLANWPFC